MGKSPFYSELLIIVVTYMHTAVFQVLATSGCNSNNRVNQSESRNQIFLQFDWMVRFSLLQPDPDLGKHTAVCSGFPSSCNIRLQERELCHSIKMQDLNSAL